MRPWVTPPEWDNLPESARRIRAVWRLPSTAGEKEAARCEHAPQSTRLTDLSARVPAPRDPPPSRDPRAPPAPAVVPWLALDGAADAWAGSLAVVQAATPPAAPPARGVTRVQPGPPPVAAAPRPAAAVGSQHTVAQGVPLQQQPRPGVAGIQPYPSGDPPGVHQAAAVPQVQTVLSKTPRMSPPTRPPAATEATLLSRAHQAGAVAAALLQRAPRGSSGSGMQVKPPPQPATAAPVAPARLNPPSQPGHALTSAQLWGSHPQQQQLRYDRNDRTTHPPPDTVMNTARPHPVTLIARGLNPVGVPQPVAQLAAGQTQPLQSTANSAGNSAGNRNGQPAPLPPPPPAPPLHNASAPIIFPLGVPAASRVVPLPPPPPRSTLPPTALAAIAAQHAAHAVGAPRLLPDPQVAPRRSVAAQPPHGPPELGRRTMNIAAIHGGDPKAAAAPPGNPAGTKRAVPGSAAAADVAVRVHKRRRGEGGDPAASDTVSDLPRARSAEAVTSGMLLNPRCDLLYTLLMGILIMRFAGLVVFSPP